MGIDRLDQFNGRYQKKRVSFDCKHWVIMELKRKVQAYMCMCMCLCLRMCNDSTVDTKMFSAFFPKRESPKPLVHLSVCVSIDLEGSWHGLS